MSRYTNNSHTSPEQDQSFEKRESVESFLARGGNIERVAKTASIKRKSKTATGINAQELLDKALGTKDEAAVIKFLRDQGFEVN